MKIKGLSSSIPKTNSDVRTTWSRCTLTMPCHFHSRAVEDLIHLNSNTNNHHILQVSYFPKQKTNVGFRYLPITVLDSLIENFPTFKQTLFTSSPYEHTQFYFENVYSLNETLQTILIDIRSSKHITDITINNCPCQILIEKALQFNLGVRFSLREFHFKLPLQTKKKSKHS
eukprot:TRINITY_DN1095_c2_g1_i2.p1 TRINITY_DN1095_c2_g1~~TRINITY_DN1095_c2_g1_i2.p1  ORF type:complete len:172 (+),score=7.36 TRINITY_DN1095_c2_g1_i2:167-682(+)